MNYKKLILTSKLLLDKNPGNQISGFSVNVFSLGAKWMYDRLNEMESNKKAMLNPFINFNFYGLLKYGICLSAFIISSFIFYKISIFLVPISLLVFYFFEIHFLFLFPLLIDNVKRPFYTSIQQTYKTGLLKSLLTVIPIGLFMLAGLFKKKSSFRNWHIGCLAIIVWYQDEIRNRL